ncbi:MAG: putative RDD family membrane protein YckC [Lentimonas sp.]|jgi:uncharacterized RDD family membrane protein YckC
MSEELKNAGSFKRWVAGSIDIAISNFIRMFAFGLLFNLWLKNGLEKFHIDFKEKFQVEEVYFGSDLERLNFLTSHLFFKETLLLIFIIFTSGALYHILLNSSKWRATLGKKLMKIIIVNKNGQKLDFWESSFHYLLSLVPWLFVIYIFAFMALQKANIYDAIVGNTFNLVFGLITLAWLQTHLITKNKSTAYDLICKIKVVKNR